MSYFYDKKNRILKRDDGKISLTCVMITREQVYKFIINWEGREILFSATVDYTRDEGSGKVLVYWVVTSLSAVHHKIRTYIYKDFHEKRRASELIQEVLYHYFISPDQDFEVVSVDFSPYVRKSLGQGGVQ